MGRFLKLINYIEELNSIIGDLSFNLQVEETAGKKYRRTRIERDRQTQLEAWDGLATTTVSGEELWLRIQPKLLAATEKAEQQIETQAAEAETSTVSTGQPSPKPPEEERSFFNRALDNLKKFKEFLVIASAIKNTVERDYAPYIDGMKDVLDWLQALIPTR